MVLWERVGLIISQICREWSLVRYDDIFAIASCSYCWNLSKQSWKWTPTKTGKSWKIMENHLPPESSWWIRQLKQVEPLSPNRLPTAAVPPCSGWPASYEAPGAFGRAPWLSMGDPPQLGCCNVASHGHSNS